MGNLIIEYSYEILGAILFSCFGAYLRWRPILKKRKIDAADKFRETIISELSVLYPEGINHISGSDSVKILRESHNRISAAVLEYRPRVTKKRDFDRAWDNFTGVGVFREKEEKPRYNQYSFTGRNNEFYEEPKQVFILNVDKLLSFADKT